MARLSHLPFVAIPLGVAAALASLTVCMAATTFTGRPTSVTDGDTFRFGQVRVRLFGVDAPEMSTPQGAPARLYLQRLLSDATLTCQDTGERSYSRVVATCRLPSGQDLSSAMVAGGWACDWPRFSGGAYQALELRARLTRRGMFNNGSFTGFRGLCSRKR